MMTQAEMSPIHSGTTSTRLALDALRRSKERTVFRDGEREWSGGATLAAIGAMQAALERAGARRGQRVALLCGNRTESWCIGVAAQALGLCISWLHPLGSPQAHSFQVEDFGADLLVVDVPHYADLARFLDTEFSGRVRLLTLGPCDVGRDILAGLGDESVTPVDRSAPDNLSLVNYTGGTTGRSKGAFRRESALAASVVGVLADFDIARNPAFLAIGPISHVTGTKIVPTLLRGGSVTMLDRFDPDLVCSTIAARRIDMSLLVPTMIYSILDSGALDRHDVSSLKLLLYGAAAMSPTRLAEGLDRFGPVFSQLYGQTECYPIAVLPREDHDVRFPERLAACGFLSHMCDMRLLGPDGEPVAAGESGEICVRSPYAMEGYWNQPELTAEAFAGGWLHTGDVGRLDEDGRLYIVDRLKDMIITGGFNVYPREVEDVISSLPGVSMVAVLGVPDPKWGEAVAAVIVPSAGAELDPAMIMEAVKRRCGSVQAPKIVTFADTLPLTAAGKVDKKRLKAEGNLMPVTDAPQ